MVEYNSSDARCIRRDANPGSPVRSAGKTWVAPAAAKVLILVYWAHVRPILKCYQEKMMKNRVVTTLGVLGLLLTAGCATAPDKPPVKQEKATVASQPAPAPDLSTRDTITATATVQAIDLQTREVTLKDQEGQVFTVKVSDEVRNLPQVRVGDRVVITYQQELAVYLTGRAGTGISTRTDTLSAGRAQPGRLPAGVVRDTARITANIISVDKQKRQVLVRGATRTVLVKVPSDFDITRFKVGEEVEAEFVQELAIVVKPAPAKPARSGPGFKNKRSN